MEIFNHNMEDTLMSLLPKKTQDDRLPIMCTRKEAYAIVASKRHTEGRWKRFVDFVVSYTC